MKRARSPTPPWVAGAADAALKALVEGIREGKEAKIARLWSDYDEKVKHLRREADEEAHHLHRQAEQVRERAEQQALQLSQDTMAKADTMSEHAEAEIASSKKSLTRDAFASLIRRREHAALAAPAGMPSPAPEQVQSTDRSESVTADTETDTESTADIKQERNIPLASATSLRRRGTNNSSSTEGSQAIEKYSERDMTALQQEWLRSVLRFLTDQDCARDFLKPVDWMAARIPDYPVIIEKHDRMDLSTMRKKLEASRYRSVQAFADDMQLIVNATRNYNGDQHKVTKAAFMMLGMFNDKMRKCPK